MFGSKIKNFKDEVYDFSKHGYTIEEGIYNVDKHFVSFEIENWCKVLPATLRYVLTMLYPVKRLVVAETNIVTNDEKMLPPRIALYLSTLAVSSDCDCDTFKIEKANLKPTKSQNDKMYIMFGTRDIKFFKDGKAKDEMFVNGAHISPLSLGCTVEITGNVEEHNALSAGLSYFHGINQVFKRYLKIEMAKDNEVYSGSIEFNYRDNSPAKTRMIWAFKYLINLFSELSKLDDSLYLSYGNYNMSIRDDRSGVIANLIDTYTLLNSRFVVKMDKYQIDDNTIINFNIQEKEVIFPVLKDTFKSLIGELNNLLMYFE